MLFTCCHILVLNALKKKIIKNVDVLIYSIALFIGDNGVYTTVLQLA